MTDTEFLAKVKASLGITGTYLDGTISEYIAEVKAFLIGAGVPEAVIMTRPGLVSRGVSDLWNYGSGEGKLSEYFKMSAIQAALINK